MEDAQYGWHGDHNLLVDCRASVHRVTSTLLYD